MTATPERLDGRGLGDAFERMVLGPSVAELTTGGFLVPATVYAPPEGLDLSRIHTRGGDYAADELAEAMSDKALVGKPRRQREGCTAKPRLCPACRVVNRPGASRCKACGADLRPEPEEQREIDAQLQIILQAEMSRNLRVMCYGEAVEWADTEEKLRQVAKARGFHHKWVRHVLAERSAVPI